MQYAAQPTDEGTSYSGKSRGGRPKGSKTKRPERDLLETKFRLAELALENLKLKLLSTGTPSDEAARLREFLDELVDRIEEGP